MFNKSKFMECISQKGYQINQIAKILSISRSTLWRKINGISEFTRPEINKLIKVLSITNPMDIFFDKEVT